MIWDEVKKEFAAAIYAGTLVLVLALMVVAMWSALLRFKEAEEPTVKVEIVEPATATATATATAPATNPGPLLADHLSVETEEPVFEEPEVDWAVQEQLAVGIYREGGGDSVCDDCRVRIADVMLNRVADDRFPDTLKEVLTQKGQYGTMYWDGITFPDRAAQPEEFHAVQRAYDTAEAIMTGVHSELYGQGYIYQSEFPSLGHDAFEHCGIYFAKG